MAMGRMCYSEGAVDNAYSARALLVSPRAAYCPHHLSPFIPPAGVSARDVPVRRCSVEQAQAPTARTHDFTDDEREITMVTRAGDVCCHVKNCEQLATAICERCNHPCCSAHLRHVTVRWRDEQLPSGISASVRLPTHTETYALCPRCSTKPIPRRTRLPTI